MTFLRLTLTTALAVVLCSCATSSLEKTWKSPQAQAPANKIAVLAIEQRGLVRQGFENRFVTQLKGAGAAATVTFDQMTLNEIKDNKRAAADRFKAAGAEAVLIVRLVDTATFYRESQPGGERYTASTIGIETMGWYEYYSIGFMSMSPTYGNLKQTAYLETSLYDLTTEKRLWSGLTKTVVKETTDRVAEMDPVVAKFISAMRRDGVIP